MPTVRQYDSVFKTEELQRNIEILYNLNLKEVSNEDLISAISNVISFKPDPTVNHKVINMMSSCRQINKNQYLYRVRLCEDDCFKTMSSESDAWNPPSGRTNRGRVNDKKESLLYVAENMETAIKEMKVCVGQCFWLIVYDIQDDLKVVSIAEEIIHQNEYTPIHNKINKFLRSEFTRSVKPGNEHEYRITNIISKFFYPLNNFDGWSYPSVANVGLNSLCLDPEIAKQKIQVKYAILYSMKENDIIPNYIGYLDDRAQFALEKIN